jgi:FkbM family methyltransferase
MAVCSIRAALSIDLPTLHVLDIGAMPEGEDRYAELVKQGLARVTGFEPNPAIFNQLSARQGPYRYLPHCLGDGRPATVYVTRYPGCVSLYEPDPAVINLFTSIGAEPGGNFNVLETISIETCRLDDVPDLLPADYIKLDVQGAELDVLRHGVRVLETCLVLECEAEFLPLYKGQPLFGEVAAFLTAHGFLLHKLIDVNGRALRPLIFNNNPFAPISQMTWADAIFIRDYTRLDLFADEELLKAAIVLHEVYLSYDVAFHLLREYDRRSGSNLANHYGNNVLCQANLPTLYLNQKLHV